MKLKFLAIPMIFFFLLSNAYCQGNGTDGGDTDGPGYPELGQMEVVLELAQVIHRLCQEVVALSESGAPDADESAVLAHQNNLDLNNKAFIFEDTVEDEQNVPQNTTAAQLNLKSSFDQAIKSKDNIVLAGQKLEKYKEFYSLLSKAIVELLKYYK